MSKDIKKTINDIVDGYRSKNEGELDTRLRSWDWCHQVFLKYRDIYYQETDEVKRNEIVDYLALHLAFYLASWGMYRGSSFLLQTEYKIHKQIVNIIFEKQYKTLWNYTPSTSKIDIVKTLLFDDRKGVYNRIRDKYGYNKKNSYNATDTLVTKVLLGTFGCIPAFDENVKTALSELARKEDFVQYNFSKNVINGFDSLHQFAIDNKKQLKIRGFTTTEYPPMKCLDLYLWEIGHNINEVRKGQKTT